MTARRDFCALLGLGALGLAGCGGEGVGASANNTRIRVLNLMPDATSMQLQLDDDTPIVSGLPFEGIAEYQTVTDGVREFKVSVDNGASLLIDITGTLLLGVDYTYIVYGPVEAAHSTLVVDTTILTPDGGTFAMRVINLANTAAAVDIYLTNPGVDLGATAAALRGATYTQVTAFLPVTNQANFEFRITPNNTKDVVFDALNVNFDDKSIVQMVVFATGSSQLVRAAILNIDGLGMTTGGSGQVYDSLLAALKFINASSVPAPVNVFVDGVVLLANVPFAGVSNYQTILAGPHTVTVQSAATPGADLISIDTSLTPASDTSIVVSGPPGALQALVMQDNNLPAALGRARIRFVNSSPDLAAMDVYVSFVKQFTNVLSNSATAYIELAADATGMTSYEFDFNVAGTTNRVLALPGVILTTGITYTVYVVGPAAALQGVVAADD
jgi:hypothetical protein